MLNYKFYNQTLGVQVYLLGNSQEKTVRLETFGIHEIFCNDCDQKYVGHTKLSNKTWAIEHQNHIRFRKSMSQNIILMVFLT